MDTLAAVIENQARRTGRSVGLGYNPGPRSGVSGLVERRAAWTIRLADLAVEYGRALEEIARLEAEIRGCRAHE